LLIIDDEPEVVVTISRVARVPWPSRSAGTIAAAIQLVAEHRAVVGAIIDIQLPDGSGLDLIRYMRAGSPECPILVLTAYCEPDNANAAHRLGAEFAAKPSFAENVRAFAGRLMRRDPSTLSQIVEDFARTHGLTPTERQVMELLAADRSREEVAERLHISPNTLRNHVSAVLTKSRQSSIAELARNLRRMLHARPVKAPDDL
jgi:DNA-binding NarL/FixJ family response regulator